MDERLLFALRYFRQGELEYGVQGKYAGCLERYAEELGYDKNLGNLCDNIPILCKLVHEGYSENCEAHALCIPSIIKLTQMALEKGLSICFIGILPITKSLAKEDLLTHQRFTTAKKPPKRHLHTCSPKIPPLLPPVRVLPCNLCLPNLVRRLSNPHPSGSLPLPPCVP